MKFKCNICQNEMIDKSKGPYINYICPICGNAIATYDYEKDDPIKFDEQKYDIVISGESVSIEDLKIISKMSGLNFLQCKAIINEHSVIITGKAIDIIEKLRVLKKSDIEFSVNPTFPYKIL